MARRTGRKTPKTLLGIETRPDLYNSLEIAAKHLKPY